MTEFQTKAFRRLYAQGPRCLVFGLSPCATSLSEMGLAASRGQGGRVTRRPKSCVDVDEGSLSPDYPIAATDTSTSFQPDQRSGQDPTRCGVAAVPELLWAEGDVAGFILRLLCALAPLGAIGSLFILH